MANYDPSVGNNIGQTINTISGRVRGLSQAAQGLLVKARAVMAKIGEVNPETVSAEKLAGIVQRVEEYKQSVRSKLGDLEARTGEIGATIGQMDTMLSGVLEEVSVNGNAAAVRVANEAQAEAEGQAQAQAEGQAEAQAEAQAEGQAEGQAEAQVQAQTRRSRLNPGAPPWYPRNEEAPEFEENNFRPGGAYEEISVPAPAEVKTRDQYAFTFAYDPAKTPLGKPLADIETNIWKRYVYPRGSFLRGSQLTNTELDLVANMIDNIAILTKAGTTVKEKRAILYDSVLNNPQAKKFLEHTIRYFTEYAPPGTPGATLTTDLKHGGIIVPPATGAGYEKTPILPSTKNAQPFRNSTENLGLQQRTIIPALNNATNTRGWEKLFDFIENIGKYPISRPKSWGNSFRSLVPSMKFVGNGPPAGVRSYAPGQPGVPMNYGTAAPAAASSGSWSNYLQPKSAAGPVPRVAPGQPGVPMNYGNPAPAGKSALNRFRNATARLQPRSAAAPVQRVGPGQPGVPVTYGNAPAAPAGKSFWSRLGNAMPKIQVRSAAGQVPRVPPGQPGIPLQRGGTRRKSKTRSKAFARPERAKTKAKRKTYRR